MASVLCSVTANKLARTGGPSYSLLLLWVKHSSFHQYFLLGCVS